MSFSINWNLEKYKSEHESDEHWQLRKRFMEVHKNEFPEDKLVCLAQVFCNIEFLGCRYPEKTMKLVAELSKGVADDYREKKKGMLKRTFVQASDAAGAKAKGRGATPPTRITEGPPSKQAKMDSETPKSGFKYSCFVHESVVKPPKEGEFPGFIIYESCKTSCPINILTQSSQKNRTWNSISFDFPLEKNSPEEKYCEIFLNKKLLASSTGPNVKAAKSKAALEGLNKLRQTCYTIQEKLSFVTDGEIVSKDQVVKGSSTTPISQDNIGSRMMMKMGWTGTGLGKNQQGIQTPIEASQTMKRTGLGHLSTSQFHNKFRNVFREYIASSSTNDLVFAPDFSAEERKILHRSNKDIEEDNEECIGNSDEDEKDLFDLEGILKINCSSDEENIASCDDKQVEKESCEVCCQLDSLTGQETDDELLDKMWGTNADSTGLVNILEDSLMSALRNGRIMDQSDNIKTDQTTFHGNEKDTSKHISLQTTYKIVLPFGSIRYFDGTELMKHKVLLPFVGENSRSMTYEDLLMNKPLRDILTKKNDRKPSQTIEEDTTTNVQKAVSEVCDSNIILTNLKPSQDDIDMKSDSSGHQSIVQTNSINHPKKRKGRPRKIIRAYLSNGTRVRVNIKHLMNNRYFIRYSRRRQAILNGLFKPKEIPPPEYSDSSDEPESEWVSKTNLLISEPLGCNIDKTHVLRRDWEQFIIKFSSSKRNPFSQRWRSFVENSIQDKSEYLCVKWKEFMEYCLPNDKKIPASILQPAHDLVAFTNTAQHHISPCDSCSINENLTTLYFPKGEKIKISKNLIKTGLSNTNSTISRNDNTSDLTKTCPNSYHIPPSEFITTKPINQMVQNSSEIKTSLTKPISVSSGHFDKNVFSGTNSQNFDKFCEPSSNIPPPTDATMSTFPRHKKNNRKAKYRLFLCDGSKVRIGVKELSANKYVIRRNKWYENLENIKKGLKSLNELPPPDYSDSSTDEDESDWVTKSGIIITEPEDCELDEHHLLRKQWERYILRTGSSKRNPLAKRWREFLGQFTSPERKTLCQKWLAQNMNLKTKSHGKNEQRQLVVYKILSLDQILETLLQCGGENEKYSLRYPDPEASSYSEVSNDCVVEKETPNVSANTNPTDSPKEKETSVTSKSQLEKTSQHQDDSGEKSSDLKTDSLSEGISSESVPKILCLRSDDAVGIRDTPDNNVKRANVVSNLIETAENDCDVEESDIEVINRVIENKKEGIYHSIEIYNYCVRQIHAGNRLTKLEKRKYFGNRKFINESLRINKPDVMNTPQFNLEEVLIDINAIYDTNTASNASSDDKDNAGERSKKGAKISKKDKGDSWNCLFKGIQMLNEGPEKIPKDIKIAIKNLKRAEKIKKEGKLFLEPKKLKELRRRIKLLVRKLGASFDV